MNDLSNYRKTYQKGELLELNLPDNPLELFTKWFQEAEAFDTNIEVNTMTLATVGTDGFPKSRVVLLKSFSDEGFVFYTNYNSDKGKAIRNNPKVCLSFFWQGMERQVIIKGIAEKVTETVSDQYFNSRPLGSQLGAIVSNQSEVIPSRLFLEEKLKKIEKESDSNSIKRPENWGGFVVVPIEIEFWQGRPNRLHDRIRFSIQNERLWKMDRLSP